MGVTAWFVYDGAVGWPSATRAEAQKKLPAAIDPSVLYEQLGAHPTKDAYEAYVAELKGRPPGSAGVTLTEFEQRLGKPVFAKSGTVAGNRVYYYASKDGYTAAEFDASGVLKPASIAPWIVWYKTQEDITAQFYFALIPAVFIPWFLYKTVRAATLRVVVDDAGVHYGGRRISWDSVRDMRDYNEKGWVDMYYVSGSGKEKRLRWDNEKVLRFEEIVTAICERKGFSNPIPRPSAREESEAGSHAAGLDSEQDCSASEAGKK
jgi:hypothetical protein